MAATLIIRETTNRLGGAATTTALSTTALNNIFNDITPTEATAGVIKYKAIDVYNSSDASSAVTAIYMSAESTSPGTSIDMGIEAAPLGSTTAIADELTAPSGVTFAHAISTGKLSLPDIAALAYCRIWLRQNVTAGTANLAPDTATIRTDWA